MCVSENVTKLVILKQEGKENLNTDTFMNVETTGKLKIYFTNIHKFTTMDTKQKYVQDVTTYSTLQ